MTIIKAGPYIFQIPDFIHEFGTPTPHRPRRSLALHIAIERALYTLRVKLVDIGDATPGYRVANALLTLLFGLNCDFSTCDIALCVAWELGLLHLRYVKEN